MSPLSRRTLLGASAAALLAATAPQLPAQQTPPQPAPRKRGNPIAISTYSFWRFMNNLKLPIEQCIEEAAAMGFDGVPGAHQLLHENKHLGKISIMVGVTDSDEGKRGEGPGAIWAEVGT